MIELGLDTAHSATIAPVWAALLTGNAEAQGHGSLSDEIRDATGRVPNLWFGDADEHETPRQRFHIEVYVAPEVAEQRIAAALAAGGTVVDDSNAPSLIRDRRPGRQRGSPMRRRGRCEQGVNRQLG
jgi:4a-hydroxytetrahydrobiopterin dehydratase